MHINVMIQQIRQHNAATKVAAVIFLVARLFTLFMVIPYTMNVIAVIGIITLLLGATLALARKDGIRYPAMVLF